MVADDKELRHRATPRQKVIGVIAPLGSYWQPNPAQPLHPRISTASPQPHIRPKRKPRKQNWQPVLALQPVERCAYVIHLAATVVMCAFAQPSPTEIEPQHRQPKARKSLGRVIHDLVMHRPTAQRVWMRHHRRV